jgi:hypothetical protein
MRESVDDFLALGPLPSERATATQIKRHQEALEAIAVPVSLAEANALAEMFGPDDCFGLSWTLIHLIETAPGWVLEAEIPEGETPGLQHLRTRIRNAQKTLG